MKSIYSFTRVQLEEELLTHGFKKFMATQIFEWVYKKLVTSFLQMKNISLDSQQKLATIFYFPIPKVVTKQVSKDETTKFLVELEDGSKVETVFMKFEYGNSACITTQVGCNMGCTFCASGLMKKERNLTTSEMVMQLLLVHNYIIEKGFGRLSHYVVMGIGEPFDNFENLMSTLDISKDQKGLEIGARHVTVSTCGIVPKIKEFAIRQPQINLAVSLHAPNNEIRSKLMPINRAYPLEKLIPAVREYIEITKRRITYEYILIDGINDSQENAEQLAELVQGQLSYVNLIPYNPVFENGFKKSRNVRKFFETLQELGIPCTVRQEKGADIDAACGQLRAREKGIQK